MRDAEVHVEARSRTVTADPTGRLAPPPPHQCLMPPQQRPRRDQHHCPRGARQVMRCGGHQCSISQSELRPSNLAAQNLELLPQHQQLKVLHVQAAATPNKRRQQRPNPRGRGRRRPCGRSSQPSRPRAATPILAGSRESSCERGQKNHTENRTPRHRPLLHRRTPLVSGETAAWRRMSELRGNGRVR
jgi:hypothetical protein